MAYRPLFGCIWIIFVYYYRLVSVGYSPLEHVACISCTVVLVISDRYRIWGVAVGLVSEQLDFCIISGMVS